MNLMLYIAVHCRKHELNVIYILVRCRKHKYLIQREFRSQDIHIANMMSITQKKPGLMHTVHVQYIRILDDTI